MSDGLRTLSVSEMKEIDGGHPLVWALAAGVIIEVINNPDDFAEGFSDGYNS